MKSTIIAAAMAFAVMATLRFTVPEMPIAARIAVGLLVGGLFCVWAWNRDRPAKTRTGRGQS